VSGYQTSQIFIYIYKVWLDGLRSTYTPPAGPGRAQPPGQFWWSVHGSKMQQKFGWFP